MTRFSGWHAFLAFILLGALILSGAPALSSAEPTPAAASGFQKYADSVESRLSERHRSTNGFLAPEDANRLHQGELIVERLTPAKGPELPGAMLHHWRGTAFVPGARAADFERVMRGFNSYPVLYAPQVLRGQVINERGDDYQVLMRVRQKHILTVVLDTTYDVSFGRLDEQHGFSMSRSTRISEIESPGTHEEHVLDPGKDHGFLWRLNTYWSYEERDGGLSMQIESVSLSRSIPTGLGWVIGPFVQSVPRESLEFTLRSTCNALRKLAR